MQLYYTCNKFNLAFITFCYLYLLLTAAHSRGIAESTQKHTRVRTHLLNRKRKKKEKCKMTICEDTRTCVHIYAKTV